MSDRCCRILGHNGKEASIEVHDQVCSIWSTMISYYYEHWRLPNLLESMLPSSQRLLWCTQQVTKVQGLQQCIEEQHLLPLLLPICDNSQTKHHIKRQIELCPADYSDFPHFTCSLECEAWMCFTYSFCSVTCNRCSHYPLMSSFEYLRKNWELLITYNLTQLEKKLRNGPTIHSWIFQIWQQTSNNQQPWKRGNPTLS